MASRVGSWASQTGLKASTSTIYGDLDQVISEFRLHRIGQVKLDCVGLGDDAANADGELTTPDHHLSLVLDSAYRSFFEFSGRCENVNGHLNSVLLAEAAKARSNLASAMSLYRQIVG